MEFFIKNSTGTEVVTAFINSSDELEYSLYTLKTTNVFIGDPDSDLGSIIASESGITEYQDYQIDGIQSILVEDLSDEQIAVSKRINDNFYIDTYTFSDGGVFEELDISDLAFDTLGVDEQYYSLTEL